jgi:hypothetical protein
MRCQGCRDELTLQGINLIVADVKILKVEEVVE